MGSALMGFLKEPLTLGALILVLLAALVVSQLMASRLGIARVVAFGLVLGLGIPAVGTLLAGGRSFSSSFSGANFQSCFDLSIEWSWNAAAWINVFLYMPLAFFLALTVQTTSRVLIFVLLYATGLELAQSALNIGVCEEVDLLRNMGGAMVTVLAVRCGQRFH
ncbi:VanZ family protein [Kineosporia babensis]|uniref:VanZ family protein n=1 Tax=Kineosporia babensis TaxID=499548 RepID=A0A9X1NGT2_9ACTN|nr:VanZ family protein [Kineosporia babensis]MCD5313234.1 VanZ family protein [Kineosporia babensis]